MIGISRKIRRTKVKNVFHHCHTELNFFYSTYSRSYHTTILRPFFRDHPGEPVPEENFWTPWCKGRLTEADTPTSWLGATPYGATSDHLPPSPHFLQAGCPSCRPTNSVKEIYQSINNFHEFLIGTEKHMLYQYKFLLHNKIGFTFSLL